MNNVILEQASILVIDDEQINLDILAELLETEGYINPRGLKSDILVSH